MSSECSFPCSSLSIPDLEHHLHTTLSTTMNYLLHLQAYLQYLAILVIVVTALASALQPQPSGFVTSILLPSSFNGNEATNFTIHDTTTGTPNKKTSGKMMAVYITVACVGTLLGVCCAGCLKIWCRDHC